MSVKPDHIPGVSVRVDELVSIRSRLSGLSLKKIRHRSTSSSGLRQTRIRGRGMEYEESRVYVPGDDVRTMDWRVMARTGEAHSKVFTEEKERSVMLVVDLSASMFFGTQLSFKSYTAAQIAGHLGWLALKAGDRLGGLLASPSRHYEIRPKTSSGCLMQLFHYLEQECNTHLPVQHSASRLNFLLTELRRVARPGTIIILLSDLLGIDADTNGLMSSLSKHADLMLFWVHDRTESHLWPQGRYEVMTNRDQVPLDLRTKQASSWLENKQRQHKTAIEALVNRHKIWMCPITNNQAVTPQLQQYLRS